MPRRRPATALLALAALLGAGGPVAAEATPKAPEGPAGSARIEPGRGSEAALDVAPAMVATSPAGLSQAAGEEVVALAAVAGAGASPTADDLGDAWQDEVEEDDWPTRIEGRLVALEAAAAARTRATAPASATLLRRLDALAHSLHDPAALGIAVLDLDTGAPVFEHEAERGLNPASNHKLLTAVAALELLGEGYRWETRVLRAGDALVLRGEGDPSLRAEHLEQLAAEVASAIDLREIRRIVVDDTAFSPRRFGPGYDADGPGVSYMAPSGALSLQWNTVQVRVHGAATGQPARVEVSPAGAHVTVRSTATGGRGSIAVESVAEGDHTVIEVQGKLRAGAHHHARRRVADPGRFTGAAFAHLLARHGGAPLPVELGPTPADAMAVATHQSAPLPQVLDSALRWSNNFTTEQILRTLGWRMTGEPGDWDNGRRALERFWASAGLDHHALEFENAAGLSTRGRISAGALAELLSLAAREGSPAGALLTALPVAGREGTVRHRLRRTRGRVRAKTGTLREASALSGVARARDGRRLGFSILVNGPVSASHSHRLQDAVVMALVEHGALGTK